MSGEKPSEPSVERTSTLPSHTIEAGQSFHACKRMYALTLENAAYENWEQIHRYMCSRMEPVYALVCEHDGPNFPHMHCLYQYKNNKKISGDRLFGAHIETKLKSPQGYQAYCKGLDEKHVKLGVKSTTLIEEGELKRTGGFKTIREVEEMTSAERKDLPMQYKNIIDKIDKEQRAEKEWEEVIEGIWNGTLQKPKFIYVHGKPGNGKTWGSIEFCKGKYDAKDIGVCYIKDGFFHFVKPNAPVMIVPEFKDDCCKPSQFLTFTDKYGDLTNVKGSDVWTRYKTLIVCSSMWPNELWPNSRDVNRWELIRRIDECYEVDEHHVWWKREWSQEDNCWLVSAEELESRS